MSREKVPAVPCPGPCNRAYRKSDAPALWARVVAEVRYETEQEWFDVLEPVPVTWGDPVWCAADGQEVGVSIGRLPELAAAAWSIGHDPATPVTRMVLERRVESRLSLGVHVPVAFVERLGCGHPKRVPWSSAPQPAIRQCSQCAVSAATSMGQLAPSAPSARRGGGGFVGSPSGSASWDQVDEIVEWLTATETWLRGHLGDRRVRTARGFTTAAARSKVATASMRYLTRNLAQLLEHDRGGRVGLEAIRLARRATRASGTDDRWRTTTPCPICDLRAIEREDGTSTVRCTYCKASWTRTDFDLLVRDRAEATS
ncbi:hypothetical protein ACK8HX_02150 [Oryzobacter sp. R7]|uniref:hypothetical protein n=1 Tax=Oryzobacter faecalis TaxID=3388656 RepID=UPI00398C9BD2